MSMRRSSDWLKSLNTTKRVLLVMVLFFGFAAVAGSQQPKANLATSNTSHKSPQTQQAKAPAVTTKTETETQSIPFTSTTVQTASLAKGTSKVTTAGVNGSETLTYTVTYTDGQQTDKQLTNTTVTVQPVTQVTSVGTYVAPPPPAPAPSCPNGTYVNSAGNTVCSPYSSPSAPAGATAQCVDGSYSFSQSHSGTCSHHGGVATWL
ncbi:MAG TPA: DUF3761 domain-containing protein [Candidatus Saccharimonadales bacterium]